MIVMLVGIGFFAALAGGLADRFIEGRAQEIAEAELQVLSADEELMAKVDAITEQLETSAPPSARVAEPTSVASG